MCFTKNVKFLLKEIFTELALSVVYAVDPGHDDLCPPKKVCKLNS